MAETIFWIAATACVIAQIAILRSTFAAGRATKSELVPAASRTGELVWALVPVVVLSVVLVATWQRIEARENHMRMDHSHMSMPAYAPTNGSR